MPKSRSSLKQFGQTAGNSGQKSTPRREITLRSPLMLLIYLPLLGCLVSVAVAIYLEMRGLHPLARRWANPCFFISFGLVFLGAEFLGWYAQGVVTVRTSRPPWRRNANRSQVSRQRQPVRYYVSLAMIACIPLALVIYGVLLLWENVTQ